MKKAYGISIGASTISFVGIEYDQQKNFVPFLIQSFPHSGNPKEVFVKKFKEFNLQGLPVVVTGRKFRNIINLKNISEPEAVEIAFKSLYPNEKDVSAIASLGSETFIVYVLDKSGLIADVITRNQCASGTGEFFLQQIKRMDLGLDDISNFTNNVKPFKVSGRCSVFCKSDCTHALNKGIPKEEVLSGLALMMAEKIEELLKKVSVGKKFLIGGVTKNQLVMKFVKEKIEDVVIPREAQYFEAFGAAIYAMNNDSTLNFKEQNLFKDTQSSLVFHLPTFEGFHPPCRV